jgi:hypothetical protein
MNEYNPFSVQVAGNHYQHFAIQPMEFIEKNNLSWGEGNIVKYVCRSRYKGQLLEDLRKARHYLDMLITLAERKDEEDKQQQWVLAQQQSTMYKAVTQEDHNGIYDIK